MPPDLKYSLKQPRGRSDLERIALSMLPLLYFRQLYAWLTKWKLLQGKRMRAELLLISVLLSDKVQSSARYARSFVSATRALD